MEQRPLRLGDILDDYCPRERRVTNHAVVALVEQDVKQTRCTTCDTEHVYKGGKAPRRKKPETTGALYKEVLAGITDQDAPPAAGLTMPEQEREDVLELTAAAVVGTPIAAAPKEEDKDRDDADDEPQPAFDEGPVHRPLIRATLPRPEGQPPPARPAPDFTVRQPGGRANRFRPRHQRGPFQGNRNGNMAGGPMRGGAGGPIGGGRPPQGGGAARMARRHGPRKKSR